MCKQERRTKLWSLQHVKMKMINKQRRLRNWGRRSIGKERISWKSKKGDYFMKQRVAHCVCTTPLFTWPLQWLNKTVYAQAPVGHPRNVHNDYCYLKGPLLSASRACCSHKTPLCHCEPLCSKLPTTCIKGRAITALFSSWSPLEIAVITGYLAGYRPICLCKKITQIWEKSHPKLLKDTMPSAHTVAGIVPVLTGQTGQTHNKS